MLSVSFLAKITQSFSSIFHKTDDLKLFLIYVYPLKYTLVIPCKKYLATPLDVLYSMEFSQTFFFPLIKMVFSFRNHKFPTRTVYDNITPPRKSHPTVHRRLSLPSVCFWGAAILVIFHSQIDVCNWSSNL